MRISRFMLQLCAALALCAPISADAQVPSQRIAQAASEPQNWLTYGGTYTSQRYSTLNQITPAHQRPRAKWVLDQVFGAGSRTARRRRVMYDQRPTT
jgi:hypothetical protein